MPPKFKLSQPEKERWVLFAYSDGPTSVRMKLMKVFNTKDEAVLYTKALVIESKRKRILESEDSDEEEDLASLFKTAKVGSSEGAALDCYAHGFEDFDNARYSVQKVEIHEEFSFGINIVPRAMFDTVASLAKLSVLDYEDWFTYGQHVFNTEKGSGFMVNCEMRRIVGTHARPRYKPLGIQRKSRVGRGVDRNDEGER
ncbi:hypothetical protein HDU81_009802 [Chytriomyces hyalinus]|nr:hypothetical protein HDU81_009802 [Chytriomyces hyalinus]